MSNLTPNEAETKLRAYLQRQTTYIDRLDIDRIVQMVRRNPDRVAEIIGKLDRGEAV